MYTNSNPKISHMNRMTKLKELNAGWNYGINVGGIENINLETLVVSGNCGIDDNGINNINLEKS